MTDTEAKALALVNELRTKWQMAGLPSAHAAYGIYGSCWIVICRAIERLEATEATEARHAAELREQAERFEAFRQEVSEAAQSMETAMRTGAWQGVALDRLKQFILPKPDPLFEAMKEFEPMTPWDPQDANELRAAIEKRGGKIVRGADQ